jgi:alpha-tubulin suppressor-like RCC1 family protein
MVQMLFICRGKRSSRGSHGIAGKSRARAAGPVLVAIAAAALCLAASAAASAAQRPARTALVWGDNAFAELGDGSTGGISPTPVAVDLPAGTRVTAAAAGVVNDLALTSDGRVLAWGDNSVGELGDGSTGGISPTPVAVHLPAGTRVTAIATGNHSLAVTSDGGVLAWGFNPFGELGDGTTTNNSTPVRVELPAGTRVTAVAAGAVYSLALTSDGRVLAWGADDVGQLGQGGSNLDSSTPVAVDPPARTRVPASAPGGSSTPVWVNLPARTRVTAIAAGGDFALALTSDGRVLGWGDNGSGELGESPSIAAVSDTPVRVGLPVGVRVTAIAAGLDYSLALTSDGRVLTWGDNVYGELGDGSTANSSTPVAVDLPARTRVTAIAAGDTHSLALTSDGCVLAWGFNQYGELGNGSTTNNSTPVAVDLPAGVRVTALAAGAATYDSLVLAVHTSGRHRPRCGRPRCR